METIEISSRPERAVYVCLLALAAAGLFYYLLGYLPRAMWVLGAVVVVVVPYRLLRGFDKGPCLVLDAEGILDKRLKVGRIAWRDIRRPYVFTLHGVEYVCLDLRNAEVYKSRMPAAQKLGGALQRMWGMTPFAISTACLDTDTATLVAYIHRGCQSAHAATN